MRFPASGTLSEVSFARLFGSLAAERSSGVLRLMDDVRGYAVSFDKGEIVDAESSAPEDTVGRVALDASFVDATAVGESIRRMARDGGKNQRDVLVEMGALRAEDVGRLARMVLTRRALRVFSVTRARYTLENTEPARDVGGPLEARWVLYRGLRQSYGTERLDRELAELAARAIKLSGEDAVLEPFGFSDEERIVAGYLQKGYWEIFDLVEACLSLPRAAVLAVVLSLHATGALDVQPAASVHRLRKRAREATVKLSRESIPVPGVSLRPSSSQPAVAVTPATNPPASARPTTQPPAPARPATNPPALARPTTQPPASPEAQKTQLAAKLAQVDGNADHFTILEIDRAASSAEVQAAYFRLAKIYHVDRMKLDALKPDAKRVFERIQEAYDALREEGRRQAYLHVLAQGGEAAVKRRTDEEVAKATRAITAEEHYRRGEMALRREAYSLAVQEFQAAVELNEAEPDHHALLGWAKWRAGENKDAAFVEAKKHLTRALELSQQGCVEALYRFGKIHVERNDLDGAYKMFQKVLTLKESHDEAERELRYIEMRRARQKKGLFDVFRKKT